MARIAGVDLPKNERIEIGLTRILGIGRSLSKKILDETKVNPDIRVKDLKDEDIVKIRAAIDRDFIILFYVLKNFNAVHIGKFIVKDNKGNNFLAESIQPLCSGKGHKYFILFFKEHTCSAAYFPVVVYYEYGHVLQCSMSRIIKTSWPYDIIKR